MTTSMLNIEGITKKFKTFSLGPLDLKVEKGTAVALVGPNGSGKSTVFRLVMNLLQVEQGLIEVQGLELSKHETEIKQKIGYMGEQFHIMGHLTIKELASLISYWYPTWNEKRYLDLLKRYKIDQNMKYSKCSKGTQKKVEFIFSMAHYPDLLLLDEPSSGVDMMSQRKMKEDILSFLEDEQRSVVIATHSLNEVKHLCDYICIVDEGKIRYCFEKDDIQEKWARVWVSEITEEIKKHPHVKEVGTHPAHIVTDNLKIIEADLIRQNIAITHVQKLELDEILEYLIGFETEEV